MNKTKLNYNGEKLLQNVIAGEAIHEQKLKICYHGGGGGWSAYLAEKVKSEYVTDSSSHLVD